VPTPAQNLQAALQTVTDQIATVLATPLPNIVVDGVSIDRMGYYQKLLDMQKAIVEQIQKCDGPFTVTSTNR
jgi:hypothetical protein